MGLTGKSINTDAYLALVISGEVHHIAGIRQTQTIIAVKHDKNAPIFQYADYGIICEVEDIL